MNLRSILRCGAYAFLLVSVASSCGLTRTGRGDAPASAPATRVCDPAPTGITGHHDVDAGSLTVRVYDSGASAPASLQAACMQAATVVLSNWERNRCADYAVAGVEGRLVGDAAVDPACTSPICPVTQTCAVRITRVPDFAYAHKK